VVEEHQDFPLFLVPILDAPEQHRFLVRLPQGWQADDLVAQNDFRKPLVNSSPADEVRQIITALSMIDRNRRRPFTSR
jgi:hypothetical protein